jgi:hypothetical protein
MDISKCNKNKLVAIFKNPVIIKPLITGFNFICKFTNNEPSLFWKNSRIDTVLYKIRLDIKDAYIILNNIPNRFKHLTYNCTIQHSRLIINSIYENGKQIDFSYFKYVCERCNLIYNVGERKLLKINTLSDIKFNYPVIIIDRMGKEWTWRNNKLDKSKNIEDHSYICSFIENCDILNLKSPFTSRHDKLFDYIAKIISYNNNLQDVHIKNLHNYNIDLIKEYLQINNVEITPITINNYIYVFNFIFKSTNFSGSLFDLKTIILDFKNKIEENSKKIQFTWKNN